MNVKDLEHHQPILKILAKEKDTFEAYIDRVDGKNVVFQVDNSIQMAVEVEGDGLDLKAGNQIMVNVETGVIAVLKAKAKQPDSPFSEKKSPKRGCASIEQFNEMRRG